MNKDYDNNHRCFICECGKSFERLNQMTGHQSNCKVHKKLIEEEREKHRLSTGLFECENPGCPNEHDGSYGAGRFCSEHCRKSWIAKQRTHFPTVDELRSRKGFIRHRKEPWKCDECEKLFDTRESLYEHKRQFHSSIYHNRVSWNKGKTKETDKRIKKYSQTISEGYRSGRLKPTFLGKHHTEETKQKLSKHGGIRSHSGRGKQGRYHGFWCNSTWELAWIVYQEEHGVKFWKYRGYFKYTFKGKIHKYYPDFQLEDETIVEIKGYNSEQWQAKMASVPPDKKFLVLYKKDMKPILEYVTNKYGKNIEMLYESDESQNGNTPD